MSLASRLRFPALAFFCLCALILSPLPAGAQGKKDEAVPAAAAPVAKDTAAAEGKDSAAAEGKDSKDAKASDPAPPGDGQNQPGAKGSGENGSGDPEDPSAAKSAAQQRSQLRILRVVAGFDRAARPDAWVPLSVEVVNFGSPVFGFLRITTDDADGLATSIGREMFIGAGEQRKIYHFVKLSSSDPNLRVSIVSNEGRTLASWALDLNSPLQAEATVEMVERPLIVTLGRPAGLNDNRLIARSGLEEEREEEDFPGAVIVPLRNWEEMPTQWFAYEAIDTLIASPDDSLQKLDIVRQAALRTWVRQGGHLVVAVGDDWQVVASSFLADLLPARLTGTRRVRSPDPLELFANEKTRLPVDDQGMSVVELSDIRGTVRLQKDEIPLMVTGNYGLGTVTLLPFEITAQVGRPNPFAQWPNKAKESFWKKLLPDTQINWEDPSNFNSYRPLEGQFALAAQMHLEEFDNVVTVNFGWVVLLIIFYILLIGPIDYYILKNWIGKLEYTWITFPIWVLLLCGGTVAAANWLKGNDVLINRIDIVDVDVSSRTLRGTSLISLFSPRIDNYSLSMTPGLAAQGSWADLGMGPESSPRVCSWLALDSVAMRSPRVGLLGQPGYQYQSPDATALLNVPIRVWTSKLMQAKWLARSAPNLVDADLSVFANQLQGTLTNHTGHKIGWGFILYKRKCYSFGPLANDAAIKLDSIVAEDEPRSQSDDWQGSDNILLATSSQYFESLEHGGKVLPVSLSGLRMDGLLAEGHAILVLRLDTDGGKLWLNGLPGDADQPPPIEGKQRVDTYLRLVLPTIPSK